MKRSVLSPESAAWLASTIDRNRKFAGMRMMADPEPAAEPKPDEPQKDAPKPDDPDKLGEGGKKALEAERTRAKEAEDRAKALEAKFDGLASGLMEGLGIKPKEGEGDDTASILTSLQDRLAAIQDESEVKDLAIEFRITDKDDLAYIRSVKDPDMRKKLAERFASTEQDPDATSRDRRRPRPDRTQGGGNEGVTNQRPASVREVREQREAERAAKNKTNSNV